MPEPEACPRREFLTLTTAVVVAVLAAGQRPGGEALHPIHKTSGVGSAGIPRLNVVAGAGFEPATSGL
jgi:hypothetical protein